MQVYDQNGRLIETKENLSPGTTIKFGEKYRPGIYYLRVVQGSQHREARLVKIGG